MPPLRWCANLRGACDAVADAVWPTRCVGCDEPGTLLCPSCNAGLPRIDQRWACPQCGAPFGWLTCTECRGQWDQDPWVSAWTFNGTAARLVRAYKDGPEVRLAPLLASELVSAVREAARPESAIARPESAIAKPESAIARPGSVPDAAPTLSRIPLPHVDAIAFVPSTAEAFRRRGFDPMEGVGALVAAQLGLPLADVLLHNPTSDQRGLGRGQRARNVAGSFEALGDVAGARLLLIDDVVTTGASLTEASQVLRDRGAAAVWCASLARVW